VETGAATSSVPTDDGALGDTPPPIPAPPLADATRQPDAGRATGSPGGGLLDGEDVGGERVVRDLKTQRIVAYCDDQRHAVNVGWLKGQKPGADDATLLAFAEMEANGWLCDPWRSKEGKRCALQGYIERAFTFRGKDGKTQTRWEAWLAERRRPAISPEQAARLARRAPLQ
jgi:hypothetical protein